jgi:hypothetical protein
MYAKKIKFEDFNGEEREQTFYFNLTEAELMEMESSIDGGLSEYGKRIIECKNVPEIMALFKKLILITYGEKSADGMYFIKEDKDGRLADRFMQSNAYSALYMEFLEQPEKAAEFFNQVIPAKIRDEAAKNQIEQGHAYPPSVARV